MTSSRPSGQSPPKCGEKDQHNPHPKCLKNSGLGSVVSICRDECPLSFREGFKHHLLSGLKCEMLVNQPFIYFVMFKGDIQYSKPWGTPKKSSRFDENPVVHLPKLPENLFLDFWKGLLTKTNEQGFFKGEMSVCWVPGTQMSLVLIGVWALFWGVDLHLGSRYTLALKISPGYPPIILLPGAAGEKKWPKPYRCDFWPLLLWRQSLEFWIFPKRSFWA